jgi:DNA-binding XRE family transcriptional regulator
MGRYAYVMRFYGAKDNYIFTHRLHTGLSQDELALLVGLSAGGPLGRYEQGQRLPDLRVGLAMEVIFDEPIQAIFAGISNELYVDIARRARALLEAMTDEPTSANALRLSTLARLAHLDEEDLTG